MKQKNSFNHTRRSRWLFLSLLAFLMTLGGTTSAWADGKSLPYSYGFEDYSLETDGWSKYFGTSLTNNNNECTIVGAAKKTGSYGFRFSSYNTSGANAQYLISPELNVPTGVEVTFAYASSSTSSSGEKFKVGYSTSNTDVESFTWGEEQSTKSTSWSTFEGSFPAGTKYIAVYYYANYQYRLYIDDFTFSAPPTCIKPTGLTSTDISSSSVGLSWTSTADDFQVQYKKTSDGDWTLVNDILHATSYTLSSLEPATAYQVKVRTYCSAQDQSDWSDAYSFTTDCATITIDANHSFSEDFSAGNSLPNCWTINNENKTGGSGWTISSNMGYSGYYGDTYLIMPPMQLSVASQLVFDNYFNYVSDYNGTTAKSSIVISTTSTAAADFTNTLYTFEKSELPLSSSTALPKEISLAAYTGQTVYIAFKYEGNNAHAWYVDNVVVEEAPACPKPTALTASNPTWQGATLAWTAGSDETEWKVIYGAAGFDPASEGTTIDNVTTNPYTLTGLTQETTYDVYVKAVKGSDVSPVSDKATFTTTERYPAPTGLAISNLTTTSATLTWTAGAATSWEVAINTTGETPATEAGTGIVVNTATYDFSELTTETTYYAFVREKDGENFSNWSAVCEFTPSAYTYLTVNEGTTTNSYVPVYGYFSAAANLGGQFIIPAANLTDVQNKVIKKLTFYSSTSEYDYGEAEFDVCIKEVANATMTSSMYDWNDASWTTVYNGTLSIVGGKMTIIFSSDYNYNGSNLLVGIHKTSNDKSGSNYNVAFYGTDASSGNYRSNYAPNGYRQRFQPKTTIGYQEKLGSELKVFDGENELTESPASFDFGLATAGATHTFTLKNTAATPYVATISSENLTVSPTEVTPSAEGVTFTVAMPEQDITDEAVVITPANESGLEPFTINVSGTVRDNDKVYETFSSKPAGWTADGTWYYNETNGAYTTAWYIDSGTLTRLKTPMLKVAAGEKFIIEAKGYSTSNTSYQHMVLQYSADGTNWTTFSDDFGTTISEDPTNWKSFTATLPNEVEAGNYYIAVLASQTNIRMFYGGEEVAGANFAINTDGSAQDFGSVKFGATAQKSYTVTNSGNADLLVTLTAEDGFTATGNAMLFTNTKGWSEVKVHAWNGEGNLTEWPGVNAPYYGKNNNNEDQYAIIVPAGATGIVINNGNDQQSNDITDFNKEGYYLSGDLYDSNKYWAGSWGDHPTLLNVAAGESEQFTVTMNTATSGEKSGNVVLTFDALNATSFTIPCTGNVKDENYLYVDFADGKPEGWTSGEDWAFTSGYAAQTSTTTASALITTPLTVAENETMTFKVKKNANGTKSLKVRYSADGGANWSDYTDYGSDYGSSLEQKELKGIPAGTVIVEFLANNIIIDDIEGFTKTTAPALALTEAGVAVVNGEINNLGNLNSDKEVIYTLKNIGNATLNATITGQGITATPDNVDIAAGETANITVTMTYAEPYGEKNGSMTISSESWVGNFVVNFTADLIDSEAFVEDFTANARPEGWYNGGWTFSNNTASVALGTAKDLITKKLEAAEGKNVLTFKAKYSNDYLSKTLNVYTSADRKEWTLQKEVTLTADYVDVALDALTDGYYYVKFEAANAVIDDVKGLKNVDLPEHDLYEISNTMEQTAIPGASYTATVNAVSLRADETVTAQLWIQKGEENAIMVAELTEQEMTVDANKTFTLTGNLPNEEGDFKIWATIFNNDIALTTDKKDITLAHTVSLTITEFENAAAVQADDNNDYTATFNVQVTNTGSKTLAANEVSVSLIDYNDAEHVITATWSAATSNILYMNTKANDTDIATDCTLKAWCWNTAEDGIWATFTNINEGFWSVDLQGKTNFVICRFNPEGTDENPWNNVWDKSADLSLTNGNLVKFTGYNDKSMNFTSDNMAYLEPTMSTTLKITVNGTLTDGENTTILFKAKENVSDTQYSLSRSANIIAAPVIVLNEEDGTIASTGNNRKVELARTFNAGWNTICVPFAIDDIAAAFGEEAKVYEFTDYNNLTLSFNKVNAIEAGIPYIIYVKQAITTPIAFTHMTVSAAAATEVTKSTCSFKGTYASIAAPGMEGMWGVTTDGKIAAGSSTAFINGFRAYFDGNLNDARIAIFDEDIPTGVSYLGISEVNSNNDAIYNMNGQRVVNMKKGNFYIHNGKKTFRK